MEAIKQMLRSKKFIAAVTGAVVAAAARVGLDLNPSDVAIIISPLIAYILGQGLADSKGKVTAIGEVSSDEKPARKRRINES